MKMFKSFIKKSNSILTPSCKKCRHYNYVESDDKLNPDKTVTKGKIEYEWCEKGNFHLIDYDACELFKKMELGERRSRIMPPPKDAIVKSHSGPCVSNRDDDECSKCAEIKGLGTVEVTRI